ncbi:hypothetical protein FACS1894113_3880 [Alphaproteobacteria bacterium]|nr:hypothetical protein FACS1894113_3880 [Alphaproteobacteria bacterium]
MFADVKRMLFNELPVQILYGFSNEIRFFYKIPSDSNLYSSVENLDVFSRDGLHIEKERKDRVLVLCASIKQG